MVTSSAAILVFAFVALATAPTVEVKILATTLALGTALDAGLVRGLLAPALVAVPGRRNWDLARWLARLVRLDGRRVPQPRSSGVLPRRRRGRGEHNAAQ